MNQKLVPDPFLILVNNPKQSLMQEILLKIRYFERGLSKSLKKLTLFFLSNPVPFNGQSHQKQKGPGTSNQSIFRLQKKLKKIPLLVMNYLARLDDVI